MILNFKNLILLIIFASQLQACASIDQQRVAPSYFKAYESIKGSIFGYPDEISTNLVKNIPYASMKLQIGKGSAGLLILEQLNEGLQTWVSADGIRIQILEGRIIKTGGLIHNLTDYRRTNLSFEEIIKSSGLNNSTINYYSYDEPLLLDFKVSITREYIGREEVQLLGEKKELLLIKERLFNDQINWKVDNYFWVDPSDFFVWKSVQSISPKLPQFILEVTKKPAQ
jgi:hypothetical protein